MPCVRSEPRGSTPKPRDSVPDFALEYSITSLSKARRIAVAAICPLLASAPASKLLIIIVYLGSVTLGGGVCTRPFCGVDK
jgi:hypothetical protein